MSELVSFARMAHELAGLWKKEVGAVVDLAAKIRTVYGFGGKGCLSEVSLELERGASLTILLRFLAYFLALGLHKLQITLTTNGYIVVV